MTCSQYFLGSTDIVVWSILNRQFAKHCAISRPWRGGGRMTGKMAGTCMLAVYMYVTLITQSTSSLFYLVSVPIHPVPIFFSNRVFPAKPDAMVLGRTGYHFCSAWIIVWSVPNREGSSFRVIFASIYGGGLAATRPYGSGPNIMWKKILSQICSRIVFKIQTAPAAYINYTTGTVCEFK